MLWVEDMPSMHIAFSSISFQHWGGNSGQEFSYVLKEYLSFILSCLLYDTEAMMINKAAKKKIRSLVPFPYLSYD